MVDVRHAQILNAALSLYQRNEAISTLSVTLELERTGAIDRAGGHGYLLDVSEVATNYVEPIETIYNAIRDTALTRTFAGSLQQAIEACATGQLDSAIRGVSEALDRVQARQDSQAQSTRDVLMNAFSLLMRPKDVIPTGIAAIDAGIRGGLPKGSLSVIGADTSVGKTSVATLMYLAQERLGFRPGYISCEDGPAVLGPRFLTALAGVNAYPGAIPSREDMGKIGETIEKADARKGFVRFLVGGNEDQVCRAMRDLVSTNGCNVVYIDYVQTIMGTGSEHEQRRETIRRIVSRAKSEAAKLNVPLVMLSQIARQKDEKAEPSKHALKESGDTENAAEYVFMLWRKSISADDAFYNRILMRVAKSKTGGDGTMAEFTRDAIGRLVES